MAAMTTTAMVAKSFDAISEVYENFVSAKESDCQKFRSFFQPLPLSITIHQGNILPGSVKVLTNITKHAPHL